MDHDTPHCHHPGCDSLWWRLVRTGTLVLIFSPAIGQQPRFLPERNDPTRPALHRFIERSPRNPVIARESD